MATTLQMKFGTMYGERTFSYKYVKSQATTQQVKTLMQAMIDNGDVFKYPPLAPVSAKLIVTSETILDLS